jgi:hypothetical protein
VTWSSIFGYSGHRNDYGGLLRSLSRPRNPTNRETPPPSVVDHFYRPFHSPCHVPCRPGQPPFSLPTTRTWSPLSSSAHRPPGGQRGRSPTRLRIGGATEMRANNTTPCLHASILTVVEASPTLAAPVMPSPATTMSLVPESSSPAGVNNPNVQGPDWSFFLCLWTY